MSDTNPTNPGTEPADRADLGAETTAGATEAAPTEGEVLDGAGTEQSPTDQPTADTAQGTDTAQGAEVPQGADVQQGADVPQADAATTSEQVAADGEVVDHSDSAKVADLERQVTERTNDMKRIQAEYVNYKRRVDRDKHLQRVAGIEAVLVDLLPVLDDLRTARQHEELSGGFKLLAEELEKVTRKYGLEAYGQKGDPFDPQVHEALMQAPQPGVTEAQLLDVMQPGYRHNDRVLRAARVAVAVPADEPTE